MKFSKQVKNTTYFYLLSIAVIFSVVAKHTSKAYAGEFQENVHYTTLKVEPTSEAQIAVFYTPFCRPCAIFHSPLHAIAERAEVNFADVPVDFGPFGKDIQASIATAEQQNIAHLFVNQLMASIHAQKGSAPTNREALAELLEKCGGDASELRLGNQHVQSAIDEYDRLTKLYYINATPTIIVNGNKRVNLGSLSDMPQLERLLIELSGA